MKVNLRRNFWQFVVFGMVVVLALSIYGDIDRLGTILRLFGWYYLVGALLLTVGNHLLRFLKWEYLLRRSGTRLPLRDSALVFGSALVMIMSPGKVGEVWKAWLLRDTHDVELTKTTSIVAVERLSDLIGVVVLALVGSLALTNRSGYALVLLLVMFALTLALFHHERSMYGLLSLFETLPRIGTYADSVRELYDNSRYLLTGRPLVFTSGLSVCSWGLECIGFWLILRGFDVHLDILAVSFVFAFSSIVGAVSLLPGGLGATEGSMTALLVGLSVPKSVAVAATLVVRFATLWFSAAGALVVYWIYRRSSTR